MKRLRTGMDRSSKVTNSCSTYATQQVPALALLGCLLDELFTALLLQRKIHSSR